MKSSKIYQIETNNCWKVKLGFSFLEFYFGPEKLQEKTWIKHFKSIGYWNLENESIQYQYNFLRKIPKILKIPILNTGFKVLKIPIVLNTHTLIIVITWPYLTSCNIGFWDNPVLIGTVCNTFHPCRHFLLDMIHLMY